MPPDNFNDWYTLVKQLVEGLVDRYGLDEVRQWHFEVWNGKGPRRAAAEGRTGGSATLTSTLEYHRAVGHALSRAVHVPLQRKRTGCQGCRL